MKIRRNRERLSWEVFIPTHEALIYLLMLIAACVVALNVYCIYQSEQKKEGAATPSVFHKV